MIETNLIVILFSAAVKRQIIYLCWIKISIAKYSEYYFAKIVQKVWEVCTSHLNTFFMSYDKVECRVTGFDTFLQKLCKKHCKKCCKTGLNKYGWKIFLSRFPKKLYANSVQKFCEKSANFRRLLFSYISALQKAINHQDWTIFSGIKSKFNFEGDLGLFQAVGLDPQAVIEMFQFFAKICEKYIQEKSRNFSSLTLIVFKQYQ